MRLIIAILMVPIVIISTILAIYVFKVSLSSLLIPPLAALLAGVAFVVVVYRYKRPKPDEALVRTGGKKAKVTITGGMWVNTIIHEIRPISLNTVRIEILREGPDSLITEDFNRADVEAIFYVRVEPKEENVLRAAQSLGERAMTPETLRDLVESKVEGTLRAVAATMKIEDLLRKRADFAQAVLEACKDDLLENGLTLETVAITRIDQTPIESYDPNNRFDAQGLKDIAEVTQEQKMLKEKIVKQREVEITEIDVTAQKQILDLKQDLAWKEADQAKNISIYAADQITSLASSNTVDDARLEKTATRNDLAAGTFYIRITRGYYREVPAGSYTVSSSFTPTSLGNDAESMSRREQWLRYCKAIALLYSHQLPKKSINGKIYVAIPKWIRKAAYELMKPSIKGIERDLIRFLLKLRDLANQKTEGKDDKKDDESPPWTYRKLLKIAREVVGGRLSMNTLKRRYIFPLEDLGYLEIDREPKTHLINLSIDGLDFVEENKPILSFFRPENPSNPSKQIFEEREGVLGGKNLGEGVKNSSTDLSDYRGNPLNQSPPWINPRSSETPLISENKLGEGSKIDLDGFDRSLREINGFPRIFYMREGYEVYRGSKPLGRTGLAIMLRRFLKANNKDVGIGAVAEEIRRWPLEEGLRAEDLPHQIYVIKRLIRGSKHHWRRKFSFGITNKVLKIAE